MTNQPDDVIDCQTCLAANTTACADCIVGHLIANDDGPIELVAVVDRPERSPAHPAVRSAAAIDRAVDLFAKAGLLDDPPVFVPHDEFVGDAAVEPVPSRA